MIDETNRLLGAILAELRQITKTNQEVFDFCKAQHALYYEWRKEDLARAGLRSTDNLAVLNNEISIVADQLSAVVSSISKLTEKKEGN